MSNVPGYVTIKESASLLNLSASRVYEYVEDGRLSSLRAAHIILIPIDEVRAFKPCIAGRPRKSTLRWHCSPSNNQLHMMTITVQIRAGKQCAFMDSLERLRQSGDHLFPGTVARFISAHSAHSERIEIMLVWRYSAMPDEHVCGQMLERFQCATDDVLDWSTAECHERSVLSHI